MQRTILAVAGLLALVAGCAPPPRFGPPVRISPDAVSHEIEYAYDNDGDGRDDYWTYANAAGRKFAIAYDDDRDGRPDARLRVDGIETADAPRYVIILDGVPFHLVQTVYEAGHFRWFAPPTRVVCTYPSMTDLALTDLLHAGRCDGYEALYYDHTRGRLSHAKSEYLSGASAPWLRALDYRCSLWWDLLVYLDPQNVFDHELNGMLHVFRSVHTGDAWAYSVGSAGLGTRGGAVAIMKYLFAIDALCERLIYENRGRVKITLTADHGHDLVVNQRISFRSALSAGGYRIRERLRAPRDVVVTDWGLVTYAAMYTDDPAGVAHCVLGHPAATFAAYREDDAVVVLGRAGSGRITPGTGGYRYDVAGEDPLELGPIVDALRSAGRVSTDGVIDDRALFDATVAHEFPDPLDRLWRAFHGLVAHPADVIVDLRDGYCHGSTFFDVMIGKATSTHGSLNNRNSTTFVLTMLGGLPAAQRMRDVLPALEALGLGAPHLPAHAPP